MAKSLTLGEIDALEEAAGRPFNQLGNENVPQGRLMAAYAMVIKKRSDPSFNMARAFELGTDELEALVAEFNGSPKAVPELNA